MTSEIDIPLMANNITRSDLDQVIEFLKGSPILTNGKRVVEFEKLWSEWLGVKYSVFVNSGSSANQLTMALLKWMNGPGEVIVPTLTWVSDISAVIQAGFKPVFVDIDQNHLGMDADEVISKINKNTKAVFLTHVLGYNALSNKLINACKEKNVMLIEDVCESHGAEFEGKKVGTYGQISNFSFYYAHHMSTIEGGMVCTNDEDIYQRARMIRSHGMVREVNSDAYKARWIQSEPDLNPDFIFAYPSFNFRSTEINAVIGIHQLKRLDDNNAKRRSNLDLFLKNLDGEHFFKEYAVEGSCNYAFTLLLRKPNSALRDKIEQTLRAAKVEFRRGMSGGGNQLRQPYIRSYVSENHYKNFPKTEHVHFYGYYIGNYPDLEQNKILQLCQLLNETAKKYGT